MVPHSPAIGRSDHPRSGGTARRNGCQSQDADSVSSDLDLSDPDPEKEIEYAMGFQFVLARRAV